MLSNRSRWKLAALVFAGSIIVAAPDGVRRVEAQTAPPPASQTPPADTPSAPAPTSEKAVEAFPSHSELKSLTAAGGYLAARHADKIERDASSAAAFYRSVLRTDPRNPELLDRAFISALVDGDIEEAVRLSERVLAIDKSKRLPHLVLGVHDLKLRKYAQAQSHLAQALVDPPGDLLTALLSGWAAFGTGDVKNALAAIDKVTGPEGYSLFKDLHAGMILELAGKDKEAGARFERAYKIDDSALRIAESYGRWLSRNKDIGAAIEIYEAFDKKLPRYPLIQEGLRELRAGRKLAPLVDSPQAGAAEVLYSIGATLTRRGGEEMGQQGLIFVQLALHLQPNHALGLLALGDFYESVKRPQMAIKAFDRVPASSPLKRNAQIQMALNLDAADQTDQALAILKRVIAEDPKDQEAIMAQGNIERVRKKFSECGATYSLGIALLRPGEDKINSNWYYYRGICEERSKEWSKAEADMKKALELQPDQPQIMNYLGYSWIDQGIHLEEGMKLIRSAVEQRPDDGYIVDSLGWAYYRIGNYEEAVKNLERAIELKPEDPTINDHLGDAYWRVGRQLEARFQWAHARDLKPEPEDLPKIEAKLAGGLDEASNPTAVPAGKKADDQKAEDRKAGEKKKVDDKKVDDKKVDDKKVDDKKVDDKKIDDKKIDDKKDGGRKDGDKGG